MVAVFEVWLDTGGTDGAPATTASVTNIRFRTDDLNTADTTNPIPIVASTTKYSWARAVYLKCTTGPSSYCNNFKVYTAGADLGTGVVTKIVDGTITRQKDTATYAGYKQNHGTSGDTATVLTDATVYNTTATNLFSYTAGSMRTLAVTEASNQIDASNELTCYMVLQAAVSDTASSGTLSALTVTVQYDEV